MKEEWQWNFGDDHNKSLLLPVFPKEIYRVIDVPDTYIFEVIFLYLAL